LQIKAFVASSLIQTQSFLVANIDTIWAGLLGTILISWIPFAFTRPKNGIKVEA
jgi:hypothetical protein